MPTELAGACTYVLLAGLPGTGKSTLAQALASRLSESGAKAVILNKDEVRAALFPGGATDYSEAQNALCMDAMLLAAGYLRAQPEPPRYVFFDGRTFSRSAQIERVIAASQTDRAGWRILHLTCSDEVAELRLRTAENHPAADRSYALYQSLKAKFETIVRSHLAVDTTLPLESSVEASVQYLRPQGD